ncbi:MAG: thiamine pyrophosphate-dependent enzyme, partial [Pseudomonadales bacterium]
KENLSQAMDAAAGSSPVNPVWVAHCINKLKDDNTVVVNELGVPLQFLDMDQPRSYLSSSLAGGLGFGLGASLGAKMGEPNKNIILVVGDGSYMFGCPTAAHHTAKMHGLPTTTIVMNNARWHAVHRSTLGMYPDGLASKEAIMPLVSLGDTPEFDKIMEACGGHGEKVDHADQLEEALKRCLDANKNGQAALINLVAGF